LIAGRLLNSVTGVPISGAKVVCTARDDRVFSATGESDAAGYFHLPLLSPGFYRVRASAAEYQPQEVEEMELSVAARLDIEFHLRPLSDVWEAGQYRSVFLPGAKTIVTFFGPDVDATHSGNFEALKGRRGALEATMSDVITRDEIDKVPLAGRDLYTLILTEPAVTNDTATVRGLGLSINGQRPSESNFLMDGIENNNYVTTGALAVVAPEFVQEYRISTNNYSAEYGRTSGFLANVITRSGSNAFHGIGYFYIENEALNANSFQRNLQGLPRAPFKQITPGFVLGGPILKERLFFSSAYEYFRSRGLADPLSLRLPIVANLLPFTTDTSDARKLLQNYPPPVAPGPGISGVLLLSPTVSANRHTALERLDYVSPSGFDRAMGRVLLFRLDRPDFIWSPYKDFLSPLHQDTWTTVFNYQHTFGTNLTNEARGGYSHDNTGWNRPHSEIPALLTLDSVTLPGSAALYAFQAANGNWQLQDNLIWTRGAHLFTAGVGYLGRRSKSFFTVGQDAAYIFSDALAFGRDRPGFFRASLSRDALPTLAQPDTNRSYGYRQYFGFFQDVFRVSSRLTVNYGIRYEIFGSPENTGRVKDVVLDLGPGNSLAQQLTGATLNLHPGPGDQKLFATEDNDWSLRLGASYDLFGTGRTLVRAAWGIFYDRPFDNIWQNLRNNNLVLPTITLPATTIDYLAPVASTLRLVAGRTINDQFPDVVLMDPSFRNGRAQTYFLGVQQQITNQWFADLNVQGSYGRRLTTTDIVNRDFDTLTGRLNPNLPDVAYRGSQGFSNYNAFSAVIRYRARHAYGQVTYTWSHAIDNQSDPLFGDFFNTTFANIQTGPGSNGRTGFSREFDFNSDVGNSDFDQRQNLVFFGWWDLPTKTLSGWTVSVLAAIRSGFPYNVVGPTDAVPGLGYALNNRPDLINPHPELSPSVPVAGGKQLLNPAAFAPAAPGQLGTLGRNALTGPGLLNADLAVAKRFALRPLGDQGAIGIRADFYNVFNHVNLNNPDPVLTSPGFGIALYGRQGRSAGFPALSPLNETARRIQLSVRLEF
jgi:hypothetical protein